MGAADKSKLQAAAAKLANAAKAIQHQEAPAVPEALADVLSAEELAVALDRHVATIHRWANAGFIPYISVGKGKHKLFRRSIVKTLRMEVPATASGEKEKA